MTEETLNAAYELKKQISSLRAHMTRIDDSMKRTTAIRDNTPFIAVCGEEILYTTLMPDACSVRVIVDTYLANVETKVQALEAELAAL